MQGLGAKRKKKKLQADRKEAKTRLDDGRDAGRVAMNASLMFPGALTETLKGGGDFSPRVAARPPLSLRMEIALSASARVGSDVISFPPLV